MDHKTLREAHLVSDSKKNAEYHLYLYELPFNSGFVITKKSGPSGQKQPLESWYRETLDLANKKFEGIVNNKTARQKGRVYEPREGKPSETLSLF